MRRQQASKQGIIVQAIIDPPWLPNYVWGTSVSLVGENRSSGHAMKGACDHLYFWG